ncbi:MAG: DUF507 family protein [Terriglobia bacterium]
MRVSREYVDYMARAVVQRLAQREMIQTSAPGPVTAKVYEVMLNELAVEDRINDKVREYLNQYANEIRRSGVSYQDMFKRIKSELVRREKVIL